MSTITATPTESRGIAWVPLIFIGGIHLGALLAFNPAFFTWKALLLGVILHWLTGGIGICFTFHRLLTHRSFALRPRWLDYALTMLGCCAVEGGAIGWVSDHRRHHAFSDEPQLDTHSPRRGFSWAHMVWWMVPDAGTQHSEEYLERWAPDLYRDPVHRFLDKWNIIFPIGLHVALYAIGGWPFLVWGGFVRTVAVQHATWFVNSATHLWGYRTYNTRDDSTNLWWVAILTYGEGWHNNHHAFQTSARHGLRWWEVDMTYMAVRFLSFLGLAYNIKLPRSGSMAAQHAKSPVLIAEPEAAFATAAN